ncbi:pentapeptide repeat-containing protein [Nocardia sp. NPDC048505]|uniref:pentapeptide repeat-containing protein n=1 Tax=unclassified Nocardia TaxID=2637762 RepID=UPI003411F60C
MRWGRLSDRVRRAALFLAVSTVVLLGLALGALTWWLLRLGLGVQAERPNQVQLTAIALAVLAGIGGAVAVTVAYRRQRDLERGRFAELIGGAVRQLGDEDPAVRIAGAYAVAVIADECSTLRRRQQCIDVLCGYLRLPYEPGDGANHLVSRAESLQEPGSRVERVYHIRRDEREVRRTIVRVIAEHLRRASPDGPSRRYADVSWSQCDFDFTGAVFDDADFQGVEFGGRWTLFAGARFVGDLRTDFERARFTGRHVSFHGAVFAEAPVVFDRAEFRGEHTGFDEAVFKSPSLSFDDAVFAGDRTGFTGARFVGAEASFRAAAFGAELTSFEGATVDGERVSFAHTVFGGVRVAFSGAHFCAATLEFDEARFGAQAWRRTRLTRQIDFAKAQFHGGATFARAVIGGRSADFTACDFFGDVSFADARFTAGQVLFDHPTAWVGVRFDWDENPAGRPAAVRPSPWPPALDLVPEA